MEIIGIHLLKGYLVAVVSFHKNSVYICDLHEVLQITIGFQWNLRIDEVGRF